MYNQSYMRQLGFRKKKKPTNNISAAVMIPLNIKRNRPHKDRLISTTKRKGQPVGKKGDRQKKTTKNGEKYVTAEKALRVIPDPMDPRNQILIQDAPIWPDEFQQIVWAHKLSGMSFADIARLYPKNCANRSTAYDAFLRESKLYAEEAVTIDYKQLSIARIESLIQALWNGRDSERKAAVVGQLIKLQLCVTGHLVGDGSGGNGVIPGTGPSALPATSYNDFGDTRDLADAGDIIDAEFTVEE